MGSQIIIFYKFPPEVLVVYMTFFNKLSQHYTELSSETIKNIETIIIFIYQK